MSKWENGRLVADAPKPAEATIVELLKEIIVKLNAIEDNTAPPAEGVEA